jgi:hypothetical protein
MAIDFEHLDDITRRWMLEEFLHEQQRLEPPPYRSVNLSDAGWEAWQQLCTDAVREGNEETLTTALLDRAYWIAGTDVKYTSRGLALTEFNTWYVRGLARRLLEEGETECEVYRPARGKCPPPCCSKCRPHEGQSYPLEWIYDDHRRRYWPPPGDESALTVPFHQHCQCTIRPAAR